MPKLKIKNTTTVISLTAITLSILSLILINYFYTDLAKIEVKTLVSSCANLTWDSTPEPNTPTQAVEYINKCIHMNASLPRTKKLIRKSEWNYWGSEIYMPNDLTGVGKFFFKNEVYPGIE